MSFFNKIFRKSTHPHAHRSLSSSDADEVIEDFEHLKVSPNHTNKTNSVNYSISNQATSTTTAPKSQKLFPYSYSNQPSPISSSSSYASTAATTTSGKDDSNTSGFTCPVCENIFPTMNDEASRLAHVDYCLNHKPTKVSVISKIPIPPPVPPIQSPQKNNVSGYHIRYSANSPFAVKCPYTACYRQMEAYEFYQHALLSHTHPNDQRYACPICALEGNGSYVPKEGTNLLQHLQNHHVEFSSAAYTADNNYKSVSLSTGSSYDEFEYDPAAFVTSDVRQSGAIPSVKELGSKYVVDNITESNGQECTICFEEFEKGDTIARMDCFCIFHQLCIERWLEKSNKCPLHKD